MFSGYSSRAIAWLRLLRFKVVLKGEGFSQTEIEGALAKRPDFTPAQLAEYLYAKRQRALRRAKAAEENRIRGELAKAKEKAEPSGKVGKPSVRKRH